MRVGRLVNTIDAMWMLYGKGEGSCGECGNLMPVERNGQRFFKCSIYGITSSESSDWRKKWTSCGMKDREYDGEPIMQKKKLREKMFREYTIPLDGQIKMFGGLEE